MQLLAPPRSDNSLTARGERAVAEILCGALNILVEEGYPRLTMRNIARRCGITVGHLSYYFSTKERLIHELLEAVIQGYIAEFETISDAPERSNEEKFEDILRFLFTDLSTSETTNFFPALWALAIHDESVAQKMHSIYKTEREYLAESIASLRPDLSSKDVDLLAVFASASIEGHTLYIGHRYDRLSSTIDIANMAVRCILDLVRRFEPDKTLLSGALR